jgi:hypothetical protein
MLKSEIAMPPSSPLDDDGASPHRVMSAAEPARGEDERIACSSGSDMLRRPIVEPSDEQQQPRRASTLAVSKTATQSSSSTHAAAGGDTQQHGTVEAIEVEDYGPNQALSTDGDLERQTKQSEKQKEDAEEPYSIFTRKETWMIIMVSRGRTW